MLHDLKEEDPTFESFALPTVRPSTGLGRSGSGVRRRAGDGRCGGCGVSQRQWRPLLLELDERRGDADELLGAMRRGLHRRNTLSAPTQRIVCTNGAHCLHQGNTTNFKARTDRRSCMVIRVLGNSWHDTAKRPGHEGEHG